MVEAVDGWRWIWLGFGWICLGWGLAGICLGREGFGWDLIGCLGWGYGYLLWNLAGFVWVCVELCFSLWRMWWWLLVVGSNVMAIDCVNEL